MRVSATTYVRNGMEMAYPFLESITSLISIVDEYIVVVGDSTDGTREAIEKLANPKIKIVDTVWDMNVRVGGKLFAQQADMGTDHATGDWVIHLQADEVIHEQNLSALTTAMTTYAPDERVEGLVLPFLNFHGDYRHIHSGRSSYRYEVKVFKNKPCIRAFRDSQGFRKYKSLTSHASGEAGKKLRVVKVNVPIFHYAYVRPPEKQLAKSKSLETFYHNDAYLEKEYNTKTRFDYNEIDRLDEYVGTHPAVMLNRISKQDWEFTYLPSKKRIPLRHQLLDWVEKITHYRVGEYKNYKVISP